MISGLINKKQSLIKIDFVNIHPIIHDKTYVLLDILKIIKHQKLYKSYYLPTKNYNKKVLQKIRMR